MKRTLFSIAVLLSAMVLFADASVSDVYKSSHVISAFKSESNYVPDPEIVAMTLHDPSQNSFSNGLDIPIPASDRNKPTVAFYWTLSGNLYGALSMSFDFYPMYLGGMVRYGTGAVAAEDLDKSIPYEVSLVHARTVVNGRQINFNEASRRTSADTYNNKQVESGWVIIGYSDIATTTSPSGEIRSSIGHGSVDYDISTHSLVRRARRYYSWFDNGYRYYDNGPYYGTIPTCHDWSRTGYAQFRLKLDSEGRLLDGTRLSGGKYMANVIVNLTTH